MKAGRRAVGLVLGSALAIATSAPLAKAAAPLSPLAIAAGRTLLAALLLFAFAPRLVLLELSRVQGPTARGLLLAGGLLALHFAAFLGGLAATSLPAAVALVSLEPLAVVLTAWAVLGERPSRRELTGVGLATAGALVVASGAGQGEHRLAGDGLVVLAVVLYGAYVVSARRLRASLGLVPYAVAVYGGAGLALLPFATMAVVAAGPPTPLQLTLVVALAVVPTLVGHTLLQAAARAAPPALVAMISPGETVGSLLIGAALLRVWPSGREALGAALVLLGSLLTLPLRPPKESAT